MLGEHGEGIETTSPPTCATGPTAGTLPTFGGSVSYKSAPGEPEPEPDRRQNPVAATTSTMTVVIVSSMVTMGRRAHIRLAGTAIATRDTSTAVHVTDAAEAKLRSTTESRGSEATRGTFYQTTSTS